MNYLPSMARLMSCRIRKHGVTSYSRTPFITLRVKIHEQQVSPYMDVGDPGAYKCQVSYLAKRQSTRHPTSPFTVDPHSSPIFNARIIGAYVSIHSSTLSSQGTGSASSYGVAFDRKEVGR